MHRRHRPTAVLAAAVTVLALAATGCSTAAGSPAGTSGGTSDTAVSQDAAGSTSAAGTSDQGGQSPAGDAAGTDSDSDSESTGTSSSGTAASGPSQSGDSPASPSASSGTVADGPAPVDALTLKGPVSVPDVPDMKPVITDPHPSLPATVTDASGTSVTITSARRVLALDLYGTLTDTIIGLGLQDRLVGRAMSDTQDALEDLPVVSTGGVNLNAEAVLGLKPDVILTNRTIGSDSVYRQLEAAGVTVVQFDHVPSVAHIPDEIHQVGAVFGMADQADELAASTEDRLDAARAEIKRLGSATPRPPRAVVLYVRGSAGIFFILGKEYGAADVLKELGLEDVASDNGITNLTPANAESLVSLDPEIVLTMKQGLASAGGIDAFLARPGMGATTAGRMRRVITAADSQLLSYGPRTPANLLGLARAIYTDAPADAAGA